MNSSLATLSSGLAVLPGPQWPGVRSFCTTRAGGVSQPPWHSFNLGTHVGDAATDVAENRRRLRAVLPAEPYWLDQQHGVDVVAVSRISGTESLPLADAAFTVRRNLPLVIMTADCLPVLLTDSKARILGMAHAGWRGLSAGVLENLLAAMRAALPQADGWRAWFGPAIGQQRFEVGPEVRAAFVDHAAAAGTCFEPSSGKGRFLADLAGLAQLRLQLAGVHDFVLSRQCTHTLAKQYFSYRRDGCTGRQACLAWLV